MRNPIFVAAERIKPVRKDNDKYCWLEGSKRAEEDVLWELLAVHPAPVACLQVEGGGEEAGDDLRGGHLAVAVQRKPANNAEAL